MKIEVFKCPALRAHWIVKQDDDVWMVPAFKGGWNKRRPLQAVPPYSDPVGDTHNLVLREVVGVPI